MRNQDEKYPGRPGFEPPGYKPRSIRMSHWASLWYKYIWILLYVAFCTIMAISRRKEARSWDHVLLLFLMTSRVLYGTQYHRQHCALHSIEQFGALYMHNNNDKYPSRPGFEPGTSRLQAPVDTNEPSVLGMSVQRELYTFLYWCNL